MILLPDEVRLLRHVERKVMTIFIENGFEEVMLPRLMQTKEWEYVAQSLGDISSELQSEVIHVSPLGGHPHTLCHWQCEPYYSALGKHHDLIPKRVFDRSGWSYRNENHQNHLRLREFVRLEAIWRERSDRIAILLDTILRSLAQMLNSEGLPVRQVRRDTEVAGSHQRDVIDLVFTTKNGCDVEVAGGHLHGAAFVKRFWQNAPQNMETACLGVSLTRVTRLLMMIQEDNVEFEDVAS